ncbi:MAG: RNA-binding protein [Firmicutes bacterium]|nr:RNA-binding protein [Bacillota bacterium]
MWETLFKIAPEGFSLEQFDLWTELYEAKERGTLIEALVVRVKRLEVQGETWEVEFASKPGITGIVPANENGLPNGTPMNEFVGQKIIVKIKGVNKDEDLVACSRKEAVDTMLLRLISQLEENEVINAVVRAIGRRSVYLDIGGGVIVRVNQEKARLSKGVPLNVQYEVGSVLKVTVVALDYEKRIIEVLPVDPWNLWQFNRGEIVLGKVVSIRDNQAFVSVKPGIIGLALYKAEDGYEIDDKVEFQVNSYHKAKKQLHLLKWDPKRTVERRRERERIRTKRSTTSK